MTENEQIQEMAKLLCDQCGVDGERCTDMTPCVVYKDAVLLYGAGYRKVERGEWIPYGMNMTGTVGNWRCSVCNKTSLKPSNFCGWCGADMRKEQNNDGE